LYLRQPEFGASVLKYVGVFKAYVLLVIQVFVDKYICKHNAWNEKVKLALYFSLEIY